MCISYPYKTSCLVGKVATPWSSFGEQNRVSLVSFQRAATSISIFRVKVGHEADFEAAAKAFGSATDRAGVEHNYDVYQVVAGMPNPTYLIFASTTDYGGFDQYMADGDAVMKAATSDKRNALMKVSADGLINTENIRFRLDPVMSYVPQSVRLEDPAFWMPKTALAEPKPRPKPTPKQEPKLEAKR